MPHRNRDTLPQDRRASVSATSVGTHAERNTGQAYEERAPCLPGAIFTEIHRHPSQKTGRGTKAGVCPAHLLRAALIHPPAPCRAECDFVCGSTLPGGDANMKAVLHKEEEAMWAQPPVALEASGRGTGRRLRPPVRCSPRQKPWLASPAGIGALFEPFLEGGNRSSSPA